MRLFANVSDEPRERGQKTLDAMLPYRRIMTSMSQTRTLRIRFLSLALVVAVSLVACGPETQQAPTNATERNVDYIGVGVVVPPADLISDTPDVFAAKNRVPHQYKNYEPRSWFAVFSNLNPRLNR